MRRLVPSTVLAVVVPALRALPVPTPTTPAPRPVSRTAALSRRARAAVLAVALVAALPALPAGTAAADEFYPVTADGLPIAGHGFGHGRGMSQWGSEGAARQGVGYLGILENYYPGTVAGALPTPSTIRVLLSEDGDDDLEVHASGGLAVTDTGDGARWELPASPLRWRVVGTAEGRQVVWFLSGGAWQPWTAPDGRTTWHEVRFDGSSRVRVQLPDGTSRAYRGSVTAARSGTAAMTTVNIVDFEQYLWGVVPRESPAWFRVEALKAQSVAARTYSAWKRMSSATPTYDICSTTACQVYGGSAVWDAQGNGTELESASTTAAVNATAGRVRLHNGTPAFTEFSASSGGWTAAGSVPYLRAQPDPWDDFPDNPVHSWTTTLSKAAIEAAYLSVGSVRQLRVVSRDGNGEWGGRIGSMVVEGAAGSVTVTGNAFRSALGLRSEWWIPNLSAIQAKWLSLGGSSSFLGGQKAPEYPVAGGAAQDFQGGTIYWSPSTGANVVSGALLGRYLELGGPGGFLRHPVADEEPAGRGRVSRFQGGHLYWSTETGAKEVHGAILGRYLSAGGPSWLGLPVADEEAYLSGRRARFETGRVYWTESSGAQPVGGAVLGRYLQTGEATGPLGWPLSGEEAEPGGVRARFASGRIYYSGPTGAQEVYGGILGAYLGAGGPGGVLGYPVTGEQAHLDGRRSRFVRGAVYWSERTGAHPVSGGIAEKFTAIGEAGSPVGWPVAREEAAPGGRQSRFTLGRIFWSDGTGAHEVHGALLDRYLQLGGPGGWLGMPTSDEVTVTGGASSSFVRGRLYWSAAHGAHEVHGAILGRYLQGGGPDWIGLPVTDEYAVPGGARSDFERASLEYRAATGAVVVVAR